MISLVDYFKGHPDPPRDVQENAVELLNRVNACLAEIPLPEARNPRVTSGWRPADYNRTVPNAAPNSKHITGQAIDIADPDGVLDEWLFDRQGLLIRHSLWMENPAATKGWLHCQSVPPRSGKRIFYP